MTLIRIWVYICFFLSGFSALIYEVAWVRALGLVLGNTTQATSCVVSVFLGGLSLGALASGKIIDKLSKRHLLFYGLVEILIGFTAFLVSLFLAQAPEWFIALEQGQTASATGLLNRLLVASAFILLPTVLMGATLPILVSYLSKWRLPPAQFFSQLYGLNTLGAVVGSLFACFIGFTYLGINFTVGIAVAVNIVAGITACLLGRLEVEELLLEPKSIDSVDNAKPVGLSFLCFVAFLTGFSALCYEILWTRLLRFYTTSSTYAFTLMISTFLLGLAIGSFIYNCWLCRPSEKNKNHWANFSFLQYATALSCAGSLVLMPLAALEVSMAGLPSGGIFLSPHKALLMQALITTSMMLLPSIIIGISFPMLGGLAAARSGRAGSSVGIVYAANTIGAVFGSLLSGLILVPALGSYMSFKIIIAFSAITAAICVWAAYPKNKTKLVLAGILPVLLALAFVGFVNDPLRAVFAQMSGLKLKMYAEDNTGLVMVFATNDGKILNVNGSAYADTSAPGKRYMRMLGQLPVLLCKHPKNVLNICYGTGTTAGAISVNPDVEHLDIVELSPVVFKAAEFFDDTNQNVLSNSKVSAHVGDGRNFLLVSNKLYDVITFEPPPPCEASVVNLYTSEFYALVQKHLQPEGLMCQWIPMHLQSESLWKMMIQSARQVFPYVYIWESDFGEALLIGSNYSLEFNSEQLGKRLAASGPLQSSLAEVGLDSPESLFSTLLISGSALEKYLSGVLPVTDDKPKLEFFLPYAGKPAEPVDIEEINCSTKNLKRLVLETKDPKKQERYTQAMHLLRLANKAAANPKQRRAYLLQAADLVPEDKFYQYLKTH